MFVGQPAEEAFGGARAMLKDGLYNAFPKPDFALGFHDNAQIEIGHIGVTEGYTYANVDSVDVTVHGRRRARRLSAQDQGPDRAFSGNRSTPGKRSPAAKTIRSIRSSSRSARFTAGPSTTSSRTK